MSTDLITVRNTLNGQLATVRRAILDNPHLAQNYVEVDGETAKPYVLATPVETEALTSRIESHEASDDNDLNPEDHDETEEG